MRMLAACLALAACAAAPDLPAAQRLVGCWISRGPSAVVTMRWMPDAAHAGVMNGVLTNQSAGGRTLYVLTPTSEGELFCRLDDDGAASSRCWSVAAGEAGSLEGGRVFIDAYGERLRIEVLGAGPRELIFEGRRDGCD
jgi:hypothetical protein